MNRRDTENTEGAEPRADLSIPEPTIELNHLSSDVIGAAIEVQRVLGPGFLESVYEHALCIELAARRVAYQRQVPVAVEYKGRLVGQGKLDLIIANELIVELKAVDELAPIHTAQLLSYLKATGHRLGLLINFNAWPLKQGIRRVVHHPT